MTIVRQASSEGRTVIKAEGLAALALSDGLLERINVLPVLENIFFLTSKLEGCGQVVRGENRIWISRSHLLVLLAVEASGLRRQHSSVQSCLDLHRPCKQPNLR